MHKLTPCIQGLVAINIAAVIFGTAALFGRLGISPFWIVDMRALFAALALFVIARVQGGMDLPPRGLRASIAVTGLILAVHWITFFASVQVAGIAVATLTFAAFPFFTVVLDVFLQRRKPHLAEIAASLAIVAAVGLLVSPRSGNAAGVGLGLASALAFALFGHASKRLGRDLSPLHISLFQNGVVALIVMPCLFFVGPSPTRPIDWVWLVLLGTVTTALMHQLYFYALRRLSASTCSGFVALEPVYAILFAGILFHQTISLWTAVSAAFILGASFTLLRLENVPRALP